MVDCRLIPTQKKTCIIVKLLTELCCKIKKIKPIAKIIIYLGHSCHSTNQQYVTNIALADVSITQAFLTRFYSPLNEVTDKGFKLGTSKLHSQVFGPTGIHSDVGQVDVRL